MDCPDIDLHQKFDWYISVYINMKSGAKFITVLHQVRTLDNMEAISSKFFSFNSWQFVLLEIVRQGWGFVRENSLHCMQE